MRRWAVSRAAIAVAALYALALKAFLAGLMPLPVAEGLVCAQHAQVDAPGPAVPHGHGDCCTAAQAADDAVPVRDAAAPVAWPVDRAVPPAWTAMDAPRARAPPGRPWPARGPPTA